MEHKGRKWLAAGTLVLVFTAAFMLSYRWAQPEPMEKPLSQMASSEPEKQTIVFQEGFEVCVAHQLDCLQPLEAPEDIDLSQEKLADIKKRYPEPQWLVSQEKQTITIIKLQAGLCPVHRQIAHLGVNASGEYLTIYNGPTEVAEEGGVRQVTDIAVSTLPEDVQQKLREGSMEIHSEEELIGILDGLSEHS